MEFILYFDYAAFLILVFIISSVILKKQIIGTGNKLFLLIVIVALVANVLDVVASIPSLNRDSLFALNELFFAFRAGIALTLFFYAAHLAKLFNFIRNRKWLLLLVILPYLVLIALLVLNVFTPIIFDYVLPGPKYVRGDLVWIAYFIGYAYALASLVMIVYSRRYHLKSQVIAVFAAFVLQIGSSVFQFFITTVLVEMLVTSITLLTLSLYIESPENFVDFKTNCLSFQSFTSDIGRKFDLKEKFGVVLFHMRNTSNLYNLYSHAATIDFLRSNAARLRERARKIDKSSLLYYLGDSTYSLVFNDLRRSEEVFSLVTETLDSPMVSNGISFQFVSTSCLVCCPEDCRDVESLVGFSTSFSELTHASKLDLAPYRKEEGNLLFELDKILENAIKNRSFSLRYQPIYSIKDKRYLSAEALLRLEDPKFGLVMPSLVIPYAENCGKILEIGEIVLDKSFEFFSKHLRGKLDYLEVNVSPLQLLNPSLSSCVLDTAEKYGIDPKEIVIEITESAAVIEDPMVQGNIEALKKAGYRIAIDDFGTGFSNLSRLTKLDVFILKFDRSMTDLLKEGEENEFIFGLSKLFRGKEMKILFEGVETKGIADLLNKIGADYIQGYYYSRPLPELELLEAIEKPVEKD